MDIGRLFLRGVVGPLFVGHGTQKLFGWFGGHGLDGTAGFFEGGLGLRPGKRHATAAGAAETVGGALLTLGALTPLTAAMINGTMITAIRKVHLAKGPWVTEGGYEYNLALIAAMTALVESGPGRPSVDAARSRASRARAGRSPRWPPAPPAPTWRRSTSTSPRRSSPTRAGRAGLEQPAALPARRRRGCGGPDRPSARSEPRTYGRPHRGTRVGPVERPRAHPDTGVHHATPTPLQQQGLSRTRDVSRLRARLRPAGELGAGRS